MNNRLLMTQSEFAGRRGVRPSAVSNWKKAGHLVWAEDDTGRLKIDVEKTEARLNSKVDSTRGRPAKSATAGPSAAAAGPRDEDGDQGGDENPRNALVRQQVIEKTLKNQMTAGKLVPLEEAERRGNEMSRQARERVMSVIRDERERLAAESDPRNIYAILESAFDRMFSDLAADIEQGALTAEDIADAEVDEGGDSEEAA